MFKITRMLKTTKGTFFKTNHGWIDSNAFYQFIREQGAMSEKMMVTNASAPIYSAPANTAGAKQLGTASSLGLTNQWLTVNYRKYTNTKAGFYRLNINGKTYYINGKYMKFNLSGLEGNNAKIEKAIATGESLVGKSSYLWAGGRDAKTLAEKRFDCSAFIHYIFASAGVNLGPISATTFTMAKEGTSVNYKNMKRGDIFFFNDKDEGKFCHVGVYLGRGLFLNDSPSTDSHGVDISSLQDPHWSSRFNQVVRRVVPN